MKLKSRSFFKIIADQMVSPASMQASSSELKVLSPAEVIVDCSSGLIHSVKKISRSQLRTRSLKRNKNELRVKCLLPGLVDAHTHLVFAGDRSGEWNQRLQGVSYQEIGKKGGGIKNSVEKTREADEEALLRVATQRVELSKSYGVTTLEIKSGYGLSEKAELKILRVIDCLKSRSKIEIVSTFMGAHAIPKEFKDESSYVDFLIQKVLPRAAMGAEFQDVFCEKGYFSEKESIRLLKAGVRLGLKPKVHAHEFGRTGGVRVAAEVGAVSADHLMHMNASDFLALKKSNVVPVLLPGTSFFLGAKAFAPALAMLKAGLPVALASDFNPGTNPTQNLLLIGTFAAVFQGLSLEQVLVAITRNAAWALDRKNRGLIAPGFRADLAAYDVENWNEIFYRYGGDQKASHLISGGRLAF